MPGSRKKCCANGCLSSASDNFDKELMMDHDLDNCCNFIYLLIMLSSLCIVVLMYCHIVVKLYCCLVVLSSPLKKQHDIM
jgi:hypothetical protein